ncbi:tetratricopeptide repeat protein [Candidatus Dependentiae bacterium]|nr:tetratricopeptide repeat protein [Candidatus Dependentiae bacterium]
MMKAIKTILISLILLAAASLNIFSEEGGIVDPLYNLAGSARILAMGNAFVGLADEPGAMFHNPAGLTQLKMRGIIFETQSFNDPSIQYTSLGYVAPLGKKGILNLGIYNLSVTGIEGRDEDNNITEKFSYQKTMTLIGAGWNCKKELSIGSNLLILNEKMLEKEASGFGVNVSFFYRPFNEFTVQINEAKDKADALLNSITSDLYKDLHEKLREGKFSEVLDMFPGVLSIDPLNPKAMHLAIKTSRKKKFQFSDTSIQPLIEFKNNLFETDNVIEAHYCTLIILTLLEKDERKNIDHQLKEINKSVLKLINDKEQYINELIENNDWDTAFYEIQKGEEITGFKARFIKLRFSLRDRVIKKKGKHFLKKIGYELYNQGMNNLEKNQVKEALIKFKAAIFLFDNFLDNRFTSGLTFENVVTPKIRLDQDYDEKPFALKFGIAYKFRTLNLNSSLQIEKTKELPVQALIGFEYLIFKERLGLRFGFNKDRLTGGFGVNIKNTTVDYAVTDTKLGINHKFSITYRFGKEYARSPIDLFNQGELFYQEKNYTEAIASWEEALKLDPTYTRPRERLVKVNKIIDKKVKALMESGEENYSNDNFTDAMKAFREVLTFRPNNFRANEYLIKLDAASRKYIASLEVEAKTAIASNDIQTALLKLNEILEIDPARKDIISKLNSLKKLRNIEINKGLAEVEQLIKSGNDAQALEMMEMLLKLDPQNKVLAKKFTKIKNEIVLKTETQQTLASIDHLLEARRFNEALSQVDNLIIKTGEIEQLIKKRSEIHDAKSKYLKELLIKANLIVSNKNYSKAIELYEQVLKVDPDNLEGQEQLFELRNKSVDSGKLRAYLSSAQNFFKKKEYVKAKKYVEKALQLDPGNAEAKLLKSRLNKLSTASFAAFVEEAEQNLSAGNIESAIDYWAQALRIKRDSKIKKKLVENVINLGIQYYRKEELKKALEVWKIGLQFDPTNKELRDNIKRVQTELEKLENIK